MNQLHQIINFLTKYHIHEYLSNFFSICPLQLLISKKLKYVQCKLALWVWKILISSTNFYTNYNLCIFYMHIHIIFKVGIARCFYNFFTFITWCRNLVNFGTDGPQFTRNHNLENKFTNIKSKTQLGIS